MAIRGLAEGLEALGHRVRFVGEGSDREGTLARLRYNLRLPSRLSRVEADLAVGFDLDGFLVAGRMGLRPYALCLKGVSIDESRFETGVERWRMRLLGLLERRNAHRADVVIVPSRYSRDVALERYDLDPDLVHVVPEGVEPGRWRAPERERGAGGAAAAARETAPTVLSVARQYPRKNTAGLLRAFREVRDRIPGARLRVVGGGPELPRLRRLAATLRLRNAVRFLGELPNHEALRREYLSATVFCLPTLQEGFGIVFLEAMAAGLPVVGSSAGAVPEVVPDGEAGLLVDPEDPGEVAAALLRLLESEELRARFGCAGRRHADAFAWPRIARRFLRAVWPAEAAARGVAG